MTNPITPPPELVRQWVADFWGEPVTEVDPADSAFDLADRAAQWGADQELEACCECLAQDHPYRSEEHTSELQSH